MGGGYYDRDVGTTESSTGYSAEASKNVGVQNKIHSSLNPTRWDEDFLVSTAADPIVFALDVTGSMGNWSKIIYDKMPMFYGQIMLQKYLREPSLSFCAVGDYTCDKAPLQVSEFGQGNEIDQLISKIYLEGGGGAGYIESYEFPAYFYDTRCQLQNQECPFFFITGDEKFYEKIPNNIIERFMGIKIQQKEVDSRSVWKSIMQKYNVFLIKKPYSNKSADVEIMNQWTQTLGKERVLCIETPKACIDVVLGVIALTSNARNLDQYIKDMVERGQTNDRVEEVTKALKPYWEGMKNKTVTIVTNGSTGINLEELIKFAPELKINSLSAEEKELNENLKKIHSKFSNKVPEEFICPITKEIFVNPAMITDGTTFEKSVIDRWLIGSDLNPLTKKKLENRQVIPNLAVKKLIKTFYETNKNSI